MWKATMILRFSVMCTKLGRSEKIAGNLSQPKSRA